jgi:ribosomal protein L37AE/L43A
LYFKYETSFTVLGNGFNKPRFFFKIPVNEKTADRNIKIFKKILITPFLNRDIKVEMIMNECPCCSDQLLRHVRHQEVYWFCLSCHQEMPNLTLHPKLSIVLEMHEISPRKSLIAST